MSSKQSQESLSNNCFFENGEELNDKETKKEIIIAYFKGHKLNPFRKHLQNNLKTQESLINNGFFQEWRQKRERKMLHSIL